MQSNVISVTADVVGLYPRHDAELCMKNSKKGKNFPMADLINMVGFVLNNNHFEFDSCAKKQISSAVVGTKFAPPYACIFMNRVEKEFLESENIKPWVWMRYTDDIFFHLD